jgi:hypothetical protein
MRRALAIATKWLCVLSPLLAWMPKPVAAQSCEWARGFQSPGASDPVHALTVFDDGTGLALYAGGGFTRAGDVEANSIAKWNGIQWSALSSGMNRPVYALTVRSGSVRRGRIHHRRRHNIVPYCCVALLEAPSPSLRSPDSALPPRWRTTKLLAGMPPIPF